MFEVFVVRFVRFKAVGEKGESSVSHEHDFEARCKGRNAATRRAYYH